MTAEKFHCDVKDLICEMRILDTRLQNAKTKHVTCQDSDYIREHHAAIRKLMKELREVQSNLELTIHSCVEAGAIENVPCCDPVQETGDESPRMRETSGRSHKSSPDSGIDSLSVSSLTGLSYPTEHSETETVTSQITGLNKEDISESEA